MRPFSSYDELVDFLGARPVLSKIGVIAKVKGDKVKKRIVLDAAQSKVSISSVRGERVILPRAMDLVWDGLEMAKSPGQQLEQEFLVLDFESAFWNMPLHVEERRFFVACYRQTY